MMAVRLKEVKEDNGERITMNNKIKKIIIREGLILLGFFIISLMLFSSGIDSLRPYNVGDKTIYLKRINGNEIWGSAVDFNLYKFKSPSEKNSSWFEIVDSKGNVKMMKDNEVVEGSMDDFKIASDNDKNKADEVATKQFREDNKKEREQIRQCVAKREVEYVLISLVGVFLILIFLATIVYFIIRFIKLVRWLIEVKILTKKNVIKFLKIAFSKDILIRVILILGILYLSVSLLKSCGFLQKKKPFHTWYQNE